MDSLEKSVPWLLTMSVSGAKVSKFPFRDFLLTWRFIISMNARLRLVGTARFRCRWAISAAFAAASAAFGALRS